MTAAPDEPNLNVTVPVEQSAAEADLAFDATPTTAKTATITIPKRNFDFNKLLIIFFLIFYLQPNSFLKNLTGDSTPLISFDKTKSVFFLSLSPHPPIN